MITIQFVGAASIGGELIEWFDHGRFSHVDAVLPDGRLLGARSDSVGGAQPGVQIRTPDYAAWNAILRVDLPSTPEMEAKFYAFLKAQIGKPYDKTAIVGFVTGRDWRDSNAWFCSELVAAALEACGWFKWPLIVPDEKVAPDDLALLVSVLVRITQDMIKAHP